MSEYTFAQIWMKNKLPMIDIRFSVFQGNHTVAVNEYLLPNNDCKNKFVGLSEKNKDWIPFFNSLDAANTVMTDLFKLADKYRVSKGSNILEIFSLCFDVTHNKIWFVFSIGGDFGLVYVEVGDFNMTPTQMISKLNSLNFDDYRPFRLAVDLYPATINYLPVPPKLKNLGDINYYYMKFGRTNKFNRMNSSIFEIIRGILSNYYGHQISEFKIK